MDRGGIGAEENVTAKDFRAGVNVVIYRICHHRHVCYKFPDCSNSHNEVTNCTVSSQHFGVQTRCWERLPDQHFEPLEVIRHQNINLMQMSDWLWACLCLVVVRHSESLQLKAKAASDQLGKVIIQNPQPRYEHSSATSSSSLSTRPSSSS